MMTTVAKTVERCNRKIKEKIPENLPMAKYKRRQLLAVPILLVIDILAFCLSIFLAYGVRAVFLPVIITSLPPLLIVMETIWWIPLLGGIILIFEKSYTKRGTFWQEAGELVKITTLTFLIATCLLFLVKLGNTTSRTWLFFAWVFSLFIVPFLRYWGKMILAKLHIWERPVIILGAGKTGRLILKALYRERTIGYKPIGFLDDTSVIHLRPPEPLSDENVPVLGCFDEAETILEHTGVRDVIVAAPETPGKSLVQLVNRLQQKTNNLLVVPDLFDMAMEGAEVQHLFNERTLVLRIKNNLNDRFNLIVKMAFDWMISLILFIFLVPIVLLIAIAIRLDSPGPVFFKDIRIGKDGCKFKCYKLRTMYCNADQILEQYLMNNRQAREQWEKYAKLKDHDPRVTTVGAFLRRFSLDELPQVINVIKGDMSWVGPRPYLPREMKNVKGWEDILVTRPGITGLWQVSGRNEIEFKERLRLDSWYVRNWSLWLDICILIRTVAVVLKGKGVY